MYHISKKKTGERLRKLMKMNEMSVRELQEELNVDSPQAVYKWINGKTIPSLENLLMLSRLFGVPIEGLLEIENISEDMEEKEKVWQQRHPPVFMGHHCIFCHPIVGISSKRYAIYIEAAAREKLRTEQDMKYKMECNTEQDAQDTAQSKSCS